LHSAIFVVSNHVVMSNINPTKTALDAVSELLELVAEDRAESAGVATPFKDSSEGKMHLLLDVLLTDDWSMALIKVAVATQEKRPDISFTAEHMARFDRDGWELNRRRCRYFARRLKHDEDHLDLFWLMLAACPTQPWTYGFMSRLDDLLAELILQLSVPENALRDKAVQRYEKWNWIKDGFPAIGDDPFAAVTFKQWNRALAAKVGREQEALAAAATAHASKVTVPFTVRNLATVEAGQDDLEEVSAGVTVIAGEPRLQPPYKALVGAETSLLMTPDLREVRDALRTEFPHATAAIDLMLVDLRPGEPLRFRPFVLVGQPGCGKSRLVRRMAELLGAPLRRYDAAGSSDNSFGGTPKRWTSALACFPLQAVADYKIANPMALIDEIDKAGIGHSSGNLAQALMPFLERETSSSYPDPGLEVECDLSHVCYAMTANDDAKLPSPLKDRLRVIKVKSPGIEHIDGLAASIMQDLAVELNQPASFMAALAPDELAVVAKAWGDAGSVRKLQKIISATVTARDEHASRH
jgi:hypothetical protein